MLPALMSSVQVLILAAICLAEVAESNSNNVGSLSRKIEYVPTPVGYRPKECVHEVPSGTEVQLNEHLGLTLKYPGSAEPVDISSCRQSIGVSLPEKKHSNITFPENYNGWLAYTAFHSSTSSGFSAFLGNFSVPNDPTRVPAVLYIFTGLQNKDWIPKVDPEQDAMGFDIIQPVLQYPCGSKKEWCVRSWYVTLDSQVAVSEPVQAPVGSSIFGNMTKIGAEEWYVGSTAMGKTTFIKIKSERLAKQLWAYNTLEGYGVKGCEYYPTKDCSFTSLALYDNEGKQLEDVDWQINPKPNPHLECREAVKVLSSSSVEIDFGN